MMCFDMEAGTSTEEDFFTALTLLHSTDIDSAEKLRQMLDESIAKKYGPGRTLATKINGLDTRKDETRFSNSIEFSWNEAIRTYSKTEYVRGKIDRKIVNFIEDDDTEDIPTISIPDEGSSAGDGALCKICNGSRIGPLILLECQECQDVYHPLCHQPPVLDLDIYDPRLVWHCAKCVEVSEAAAIVAASGIQDKRHSRVQKSPTIQKNDAESAVRTANDSEDRTNYFRRNKNQFQLRNTSIGVRRSAKRQTKTTETFGTRVNESLKNCQTLPSSGSTSSTLHLRRRVGSKLTVTRTTNK